VAVLALLERHNFPAERLVRTHSGSLFVVDGALTILVTTFVGGNPVDYSPVSLGALAATVGRLHAIRIAQSDNGSLIRPAEMLPESELAYARRRLDGVANCVPPTFNERYHDIRAAINQFDVPGDLPVALLHNDCHPANARRLADGSVVLVDWEGAGWGPRVIDLGFLLVSGEIEAFRPNRLPANPARVGAIVDGYRDYIRPTMAELEWLPAAIRFRSIVAGAAAIADAIEANGLLEDRPWWWTRYQAADDIAERARRRFGG
jgi:Ser/Thr protein kinase RdoA (MazF antagonist)